MLSGMREGVSRAASIVKSLNHFSRQTGSKDEDCDVKSVIENCLEMLSSKLKHRVTVKTNYTDQPYKLKGNEGRLHQSFLNILSNAQQAIPEKGEIVITTQLEGERLILLFKDSGEGIDEEDISRINEPFFTTKEPGQGTGLGLAITHSIVEEHGGTIEYSSQIKCGTTVKVSLPVSV